MSAEESGGGERTRAKALSSVHRDTEREDIVGSWSTCYPSRSSAEIRGRRQSPSIKCSVLMFFEYWYSTERWEELATLFTETHHQLFSLPPRPLLLIALSAGLSALKTPSCHSKHASSTANASSTTTSVCPICSTELNELARKLPYAQHSKSYVENDPVKLPNGRVYGRDRLLEYCKKIGLDERHLQDPTTGELFQSTEIKKVFIT